MKRVLFATMLVCIAGVAAACPAPPPPGWSPPRIVSIDVGPVVAGEDFTLTAVVQDDTAVSTIAVDFTVPASVRFQSGEVPHPSAVTCEPVTIEPQALVTVEFSCSATHHAANGTWVARVSATDDHAPVGWFGDGATTFEVTGGTDDVTPPQVESVVVDPDPVTVGSPIAVTVRLSDEHPLDVPRPLRVVRAYELTVCEETGRRQPSPTELEIDHVCPSPVAAGPAEVSLLVRDLVGNTTTAHRWVTITEP